MRKLFVISLLVHLNTVTTDFTPDFNQYLIQLYTTPAQLVLERLDFGNQGSFGGKSVHNETLNRQPVIIVHGVTNLISNFAFVRQHLIKKGYKSSEIYGTTYGDGGRKYLLFVKLQCQYVRQIRALIMAVSNYTSSPVDILAFSMGSPITRKAILGGLCDGINIGPPLTDLVDTFVSIAGANYGSSLCVVPFWICSMRNGLHCKSRFLKDLNTQPEKYEGEYSFAIYSDGDDKVGVNCCGTNCSSLPHSDGEFQLHGHDHDQVMVASLDLQLSLITNHTGTI